VNPRTSSGRHSGNLLIRIPLGLLRLAPVLFGLLALLLWEAAVRLADVPAYLLPGPIAIAGAFASDPVGLLQALAATLFVTFAALLVAALLGGAMAVAMSASRLAQAAIQPWAVALQVTPLPAIAPLIIIWVGEPFAALVVPPSSLSSRCLPTPPPAWRRRLRS
jgi:NitT/TauT family transport system permease protein